MPAPAGGGGCCTLTCTLHQQKPRNHAEQRRQQRPRSRSHVHSPPHRTWEPDHHTRDSPKKPTIPTKTSPHPAETPVSHVQRLRHSHHQAHPPRPTPRSVHFRLEIGPIQPGQPDVETRTTSSRAKATCHAPRNRQRTADPRNRTDLDAEMDRSRREFRPISVRSTTDLGAEYDRSRAGERPISAQPFLTVTFERDVCTS